jgi:hypothetical protein
MYLFPQGVLGTGPTISVATQSKGPPTGIDSNGAFGFLLASLLCAHTSHLLSSQTNTIRVLFSAESSSVQYDRIISNCALIINEYQ